MRKWGEVSVTVLEQAEPQPALRQELRTALQFCFWILLLGPVAQVLLWATVEGPSVPLAKVAHLYLLVLVNFLCYTPLFGAGLLLIRSRRLRYHWLLIGAGSTALSLLASLCATALSFSLGNKVGRNWELALLFSTCRGLAVTALVLIVARMYHSAVVSRLQAQHRELERERAHRAAVEAQWNSLESRVHPHFLFNTLSSIRELMHRDIAEADVMIQRFSSLIRFSLDSNRNTLVPLAEEWQTVTGYLEIEKMRLGSRLTYKLSLPPECSNLQIPALSVLTLVENSVKHAVASRRSGGEVNVSALVENNRLIVDVCDDGYVFCESAIQQGHGLDLLLRRLESLYGNSASLLLPSDNSPKKVRLAVPISTQNASVKADEQTSLLPG